MTRRDLLIATAMTAGSWFEQLTGGRDMLWLHLLLAAVMAMPIAVSRRWPWLPALGCAAALLIYGAHRMEPDATGEVFAIAASYFLVGSRMDLRPGIAIVVAMNATVAVSLALQDVFADIFFASLFLMPPFVLGRAVRARRLRIEELEVLNRRLAEQRERTAQLAAEAERNRIRGDLEAVVAAGLDTMIARAQAGERLVDDDPDAAAAAFEDIRAAGAEATGELRRLLRLLHA